MKLQFKLFVFGLLAVILLSACGAVHNNSVSYSLKTDMRNGKMMYVGVGGNIDGVINLMLKANVGDIVNITLISGDGIEHDIVFPDFNAVSPHVFGQGDSIMVAFLANQSGSFVYYCNLLGNRESGMEGKFRSSGGTEGSASSSASSTSSFTPVAYTPTSMVGMATVEPYFASSATAIPATGADIVRDPTDLPGPIGNRAPTTVRIDLEAMEVVGQLADGTTYPTDFQRKGPWSLLPCACGRHG